MIDFDRLTCGYGRKSAGTVLKDFTWSVPLGVTSLLGPNGAGKSTLLKCLVGELKPWSGSIAWVQDGDGRSVLVRSRDIGYVPQSSTLPGHLRAAQAVEYCAWLNGAPADRLGAAATWALELVDLRDQAAARVRTLSGGQRQRLLIAAGLAHRPRVLILDEPTVGLDPAQRVNVRAAIRQLRDIEAVLLTTHLLDDVHQLGGHVGVINRGQLLFSGSVQELEERAPDEHDYGSSDIERAYVDLVNKSS